MTGKWSPSKLEVSFRQQAQSLHDHFTQQSKVTISVLRAPTRMLSPLKSTASTSRTPSLASRLVFPALLSIYASIFISTTAFTYIHMLTIFAQSVYSRYRQYIRSALASRTAVQLETTAQPFWTDKNALASKARNRTEQTWIDLQKVRWTDHLRG